MFSSKVRYALKACIVLARMGAVPDGTGAVTVREMAADGELRPAFLAKVVAELASARVVRARKGPGGGVTLARDPAEMPLRDVVFAVERAEDYKQCVLDDHECREYEGCPLFRACATFREDILGNTTVQEAAKAYTACGFLAGSELDKEPPES